MLAIRCFAHRGSAAFLALAPMPAQRDAGRASACDGVGHRGLVGDRPTTENLTGDRMVGFEKLLFNGLCDKRFSHR